MNQLFTADLPCSRCALSCAHGVNHIDQKNKPRLCEGKVTASKCFVTKKTVFAGQASKLVAESLGYSSLRPQQEKIVLTFVQDNDAIKQDFSLI